MAELSRYVLVAQQLGFVGPAQMAALHERVQAMLDAGESPDRRALLLETGAITPEQDAAVIDALGGVRDTTVREQQAAAAPPKTQVATSTGSADKPQHPPTLQVPDFEPAAPLSAQVGNAPQSPPRMPVTPSTAAHGDVSDAAPMFVPGRSIAATFGDKDLDLTDTSDSATIFTLSPGEPLSERSRRVQEAGVAPKFDVRDVLGRGGMGEVWRARDRDLRREVAIKTLLRPQDADTRRRFIEEAQVTGQLEHPNIVPIHEMGLDNSQRPYIVMKCVKGRSLAQVLHALSEGSPSGLFATNPSDTRHSSVRAAVAAQDEEDARAAEAAEKQQQDKPKRREVAAAAAQHRASKLANRGKREAADPTAPDQEDPSQVLTRLLDIYKKVCDAVAYAHSRGVLHRDLKPENIMVGEFGEVLVMDWGLAKILGRTAQPSAIDDLVMSDRFEEGQEHTVEGTVKGTPAYMAPEQAMGDISKLDARTDIYALGALLYEMLTLSPPYEGSSPLKVLADVARGELVPPNTRTPDRHIPRELEAVVLKAMAKKPASRYQSIAALKADIDAYLSGRTLEAANYTPWQLLKKWAARNKPAVVGAAASLLTLIAGIIFTMTLMHERDLAEARERQQNEIDRLNERQEEQRVARERAQDAVQQQHRDAANESFAAAQEILRRAAPVRFNRASPQSYFLAHMPAMLELSRAYITHPNPPAEWAELLSTLTLDLQRKAQNAGIWALAEHIAHSAGFSGAITDEQRDARIAEARAELREQVDMDRERLLAALQRIGEAEKLDSERGGLAPGELGERARQAVSVNTVHAVVQDILNLLAADNARLVTRHGGEPGEWAPYVADIADVADTERDGDGTSDSDDESADGNATENGDGRGNGETTETSPFERPLSQHERFMLVQALGYAGDVDSTFEDLTAASLTVRVLTDLELLLPIDETVAWIWTAARLESQHPGSVGDWDTLVAGARERHGAASPVGVALEQVNTYLALVRGGALPRPSRDPVLFDTLVRQLGDWVATSAQSGSTYTAEVLAMSASDAVFPAGTESRLLTARQQAFVLAQLGILNDLLPPNADRPDLNALTVLRIALEAPDIDDLEDRARDPLPRTRAEAAAMALARIGDDQITKTLFHRRVDGSESSQFFRRTRLPFRLLSMDQWPEPEDAQAFMDRGRARYMKGELAAAIEDFAMVVRLESQAGGLRPGTQGLATRAFQYRGKALEAMGDNRKALAAYRQATRLYPTWREGYQLTGALLLKLGDVDGAIEELQRCLSIAPTDVLALIALGDAYTERGDNFAALAAYAKAISQRDHRAALALVKRARVAMLFNDIDVATADVNRAIEINPMLVDAYLLRAELLAQAGEAEKALADLTSALSIDPNNADAYVMRGRILAGQSDHVAALADLARARRVDPENDMAHGITADLTLRELRKPEEAIPHYERVVELNPAAWGAWFNLGVAMALTGDLPRAQECFEWALRLCPPWKRGEFEAVWRDLLRSDPPPPLLRGAADPSTRDPLPERAAEGEYHGALEDSDEPMRGAGQFSDRVIVTVEKNSRLHVELRSDDFDALLYVFRVRDGRLVYANNEADDNDGVYDAAVDMEVEDGGEFVIVITSNQPGELGGYVVKIWQE